ncbi:DUF4352 domain-containing protein [Rhodococcus qingshengii]|uniref:DUF4352 domain-containing protein n=1 Tax=Rhodococcus qingshengii TaxID=334542 RepID=UPI002109B31C|nr:DUF4352 domain-containing protein [Rhodococcus qingshengii]MCQ4148648.1 DUF4352 domain-containing protein [Rhodococcus qingshengii]
MNKTFAAVAAISLALLAGGCSSNDPVAIRTVTETAPATTTTPSPVTKPATNARGFIEKQFDANSGIGCKDPASEPCDIEFIVGTPITPSNCNSQYEPENGKLIALPVTVTTKLGADMSYFSGMWNPNSFSALKPSGTTLPRVTSAATYGCDESDSSIPDTLAPASKYEGFVVLDIPADSTALMFTPHFTEGGWEWKL